MDGTRIVLVRHGEAMNQVNGIYGGHDGCGGLSDRGRSQAERLRERLAATGELDGAAALYASLMPRAFETATIIAPALGDLEIRQDCDFCEVHPGECDGESWVDVDARYPSPEVWDPDFRRDPGSETWNEMAVRVRRGLDRIVEQHPGETVVVACHGGVVVQAMVRWLDLDTDGDPGGRAWFQAVNTSLTEFRLEPNPWRASALGVELVRFNDHAHLLGPDPTPTGDG